VGGHAKGLGTVAGGHLGAINTGLFKPILAGLFSAKTPFNTVEKVLSRVLATS
jgi:hypothetical protein